MDPRMGMAALSIYALVGLLLCYFAFFIEANPEDLKDREVQEAENFRELVLSDTFLFLKVLCLSMFLWPLLFFSPRE